MTVHMDDLSKICNLSAYRIGSPYMGAVRKIKGGVVMSYATAKIRVNSLLWVDFLKICQECEISYNRRLEILMEQDIKTYNKLSKSDSLDEVEPKELEVE